jgi:2-isopropylmalate synthase
MRPRLQGPHPRRSRARRGTRVLVTSGDGNETWGTVDVADNIIEASWQALVDSIEYKLRRDERKGQR